MPTNRPVISTQKNLKENQLHGSYDFPVDIHMDYFRYPKTGNIPCTFPCTGIRKWNFTISFRDLCGFRLN